MPVRIFTDAQLELLKGLLPEFMELQKTNSSLREFWEKAIHEYFEENPGPETDYEAPAPVPKLTKKGKASKRQMTARPAPKAPVFASLVEWRADRQKKIRDWFNNATSKARQNRKPLVKIVVSATSAKRDRILSEEQLYSKMFYESRIKERVEARMIDEPDGSIRLKIQNEMVREMWRAEEAEIRKKVQEEHTRLVVEKRKKEEELAAALEKDEDAELSPEEYAIFQEALPSIMDSFLEIIYKRSGMAVTALVGGPRSENINGGIKAYSFHIGQGTTTFFSAFPDFKQSVSPVFSKYCHDAFPEALRLRRALSIDESQIVNPRALFESGRRGGRLCYRIPAGTPPDGENPLASAQDGTTSGNGAVENPTEGEGANAENAEGSGAGNKRARGGDESETDTETDTPEKPPKKSSTKRPKAATKRAKTEQEETSEEEPIDEAVPPPAKPSKQKGRSKEGGAKRGKGKQKKGDGKEVNESGDGKEMNDGGDGKEMNDGGIGNRHEAVGVNVEGPQLMLDPEHHTGYFEQYQANDVPQNPDPTFPYSSNGASANGVLDGQQMQYDGLPQIPGWIPEPAWSNSSGLLGMLYGPLTAEDMVMVGGQALENAGSSATNDGKPADADDQGLAGGGMRDDTKHAVGGGEAADDQMVDNAEVAEGDGEGSGPRKSGRGRKLNVELPDWLVDAHAFLSQSSLDETWTQLIEDWFTFEKGVLTMGGAGNGRLGTAFRPPEISKWLPNRVYTAKPPLQDVAAFATSWEKWWKGVRKPEKIGHAGVPDGNLGDLSGIRKAGPSGVHTALIGLAWWANDLALKERWREAAKDVAACFGHLGRGRT